ncbi:hypothetical protein CYY_001493 [Polysphondylium violaceum]|uniref:Uncharacterized protein n=1 Tax=Polysphondylium violaceum TaxID=133409 RepID=A0A8J4Q2Z0_9MYCE|nr:hypothetical protein CYY_001493 [Polysphondylium violaceum]
MIIEYQGIRYNFNEELACGNKKQEREIKSVTDKLGDLLIAIPTVSKMKPQEAHETYLELQNLSIELRQLYKLIMAKSDLQTYQGIRWTSHTNLYSLLENILNKCLAHISLKRFVLIQKHKGEEALRKAFEEFEEFSDILNI